MSKSKLLKNWIVVNSKSHPDRVYYFNVKTRQSSWLEPTANNLEQITKKAGSSRKRKKSDEDDKLHGASTPEYESPKKESLGRKKLVAKRSVSSSAEKSSQEKETPQMIALREKMMKKKEKQPCIKKVKAPTNVSPTSSSQRALSKPKVSASMCESNTNEKQEALTPQMRVIYAKMEARLSGESSSKSKKSWNSTIDTGNEEKGKDEKNGEKNTKQQTPKSRSSKRISIADSTNTSISTQSRSTVRKLTSPKNSVQQKDVPEKKLVDSNTSITKKARRSIYKKNIAKERMEKLRRSLKLERDKTDENTKGRRSLPNITKKTTESANTFETPANIYKNVEVRLTRLSNKLTRSKLPSDKSSLGNQTDDVEELSSCSESVVTAHDLIKQSAEDSFCEEMDWEPMEDEEITCEVQAIRTQLCADHNRETRNNIPSYTLDQSVSPNRQEKRQLYIVVDTNVFLSNIQAIDLARDTTFTTYDRPIIVVPWTVIRELDFIKGDASNKKSAALCGKARRAVHYLNKLFSSKQRIIGQTPEDVAKNKEKFAIDCPDDEILQTCLQIRDLGKSVVLLSYDKNLCNKAMVYDITTLGRHDPLEKIDYLHESDNTNGRIQGFASQVRANTTSEPDVVMNKELRILDEMFDDAKSVIKEFLTPILCKEMHDLYGNYWEKYVIIRPPWSTVSVLKCAIKHWIAATSESFSRKADEILKELLTIFNGYPSSGSKLKDVGYTLDKCSDLIQMVNTDKHPDLMVQASRKIEELKKKLLGYEAYTNEKKLRDVIGVEENVIEQQRRAEKAFRFFEAAYAYSRDMGGLAADTVGMPCTIPHERPNPVPSLDYVKQIQPELAANVNKLLHTLSAVMEEANNGCMDHRTLISLYQTLVTFLPENLAFSEDLTPLDVYCCVKQKGQVLKAGIRQLQELSTHFCRLASYRCT